MSNVVLLYLFFSDSDLLEYRIRRSEIFFWADRPQVLGLITLLSQNDLDLDLFCSDVVKADLHTLKVTPFPNAPIGSHNDDFDINEASTVVDVSLGKHRI